jgi:hypothetical protein
MYMYLIKRTHLLAIVYEEGYRKTSYHEHESGTQIFTNFDFMLWIDGPCNTCH